jgi:hypothetical protein
LRPQANRWATSAIFVHWQAYIPSADERTVFEHPHEAAPSGERFAGLPSSAVWARHRPCGPARTRTRRPGLRPTGDRVGASASGVLGGRPPRGPEFRVSPGGLTSSRAPAYGRYRRILGSGVPTDMRCPAGTGLAQAERAWRSGRRTDTSCPSVRVWRRVEWHPSAAAGGPTAIDCGGQ